MLLFTLPKQVPVSAGSSYAAAKLYFFRSGTSTAATVYSDSTLSTAHAVPVVASSAGVFPAIYLDPAVAHKVRLSTSAGSLIYEVDPINVVDVGQALTANETAAGLTSADIDTDYDVGDVRRYGAVGDNVADDSVALARWWSVGQQNVRLFCPRGTYRTSAPLRTTIPISVNGEFGTRIRLTAAANYVIEFDYRGGAGTLWNYKGECTNLVLDGGGVAIDGLSLRGTIDFTVRDLQATNVTRAGLHLWWAQLCLFDKYICSGNVEAFTTTPLHGVLIDTQSSSANTFLSATIEKVSGAGVRAISMVNTLWLNGTSEGNAGPGFDMGEASGALTCIGNTVVGMDLEVNGVSDVRLMATASNNTFTGLQAGFNSPAILCEGGSYNTFLGGLTGGFSFDANSNHNRIFGTRILGAGRGITDAGGNNSYQGVFNFSDGLPVVNKDHRSRQNFIIDATGSVSIDSATTSLAVLTFSGGSASTITFNAPTRPGDGNDLDVCIHVAGAGELTLAWNSGANGFKQAGITVPANGFCRTYSFRYDVNYGFWYLRSQTAADIPN